jgi:hypothetical protein
MTLARTWRRTAPIALLIVLSILLSFPAEESAARRSTVENAPDDRAPVVSIEGAPTIEGYHEYHYFRFSSDVPGSDLYCSLGEDPFVPCKSGAYRHIPFGLHTFSVHAVSPGGTRGEVAVAEYESRDPNWD